MLSKDTQFPPGREKIEEEIKVQQKLIDDLLAEQTAAIEKLIELKNQLLESEERIIYELPDFRYQESLPKLREKQWFIKAIELKCNSLLMGGSNG